MNSPNRSRCWTRRHGPRQQKRPESSSKPALTSYESCLDVNLVRGKPDLNSATQIGVAVIREIRERSGALTDLVAAVAAPAEGEVAELVRSSGRRHKCFNPLRCFFGRRQFADLGLHLPSSLPVTGILEKGSNGLAHCRRAQ